MHTHIELAPTSLPPADAERILSELLSTYGKTMTPGFRNGTESLTLSDGKGGQSQATYAELVTSLHLTGVCELDRLRWHDTDPYGTVSMVVPEGLPPFVVGTGPRNSAPLTGPGYLTNDVVGELLDDVLHYRRQAASLSNESDMFRPAFRAYRNYLAASISAIDAFLNRLSWFARNDSTSALVPADLKLLSRKTLPLDKKIRQWLPLLAGGRAISESGEPWTSYQAMRNARNAFVHVNDPDFLFALRDAAEVLNLCRAGVGGLLIEACELLSRNPQPALLRVARAPLARFVSRR